MFIALALGGILLCAAALAGRHIYRNTARTAYLRQLKGDRIRRSKRRTKADVVWIQPLQR